MRRAAPLHSRDDMAPPVPYFPLLETSSLEACMQDTERDSLCMFGAHEAPFHYLHEDKVGNCHSCEEYEI